MKCLVTGAAGFIGSNLTKELLKRGHTVWGIDNFSTGKQENVVDVEEHIYCWDINDSFHYDCPLNANLDDLDVIFHLAAKARIQPSFKHPISNFNTNVIGTVKMLEMARHYGAAFVYAGSSSFYYDIYANPYTFTKHMGEESCLLYHKIYEQPVSIARFFNVYGPNQIEEGEYATVIGIFERQYAAGKPLTVTGDGKKRRDFTHVSDIVNGLILMSLNLLSEKPDDLEIFNLGTGYNHAIIDVAKMFNPDKIQFIPDRPGEADTTLADLSLAKRIIGYEPIIKLKDYISEKTGL